MPPSQVRRITIDMPEELYEWMETVRPKDKSRTAYILGCIRSVVSVDTLRYKKPEEDSHA